MVLLLGTCGSVLRRVSEGASSSQRLLQAGYNAALVAIGAGCLGFAAGSSGTFLFLRKRALVSDAVAHATGALLAEARVPFADTADAILRGLRSRLSPETVLRTSEPLGPKTTMRVGGAAELYAEPADTADLQALLAAGRVDQAGSIVDDVLERQPQEPAALALAAVMALVGDAGVEPLAADVKGRLEKVMAAL